MRLAASATKSATGGFTSPAFNALITRKETSKQETAPTGIERQPSPEFQNIEQRHRRNACQPK
jgi:hypothetical protein